MRCSERLRAVMSAAGAASYANPPSSLNSVVRPNFPRMKRQLTAAFVCVPCRRVFKRPSHRRVGSRYRALDYTPFCPHCRTALHRVGDAFRAPAADDSSAWQGVARDINRGRTFVRDEGFGHPVVRPKRQATPKGVRSLFQLPARKRGKSVA